MRLFRRTVPFGPCAAVLVCPAGMGARPVLRTGGGAARRKVGLGSVMVGLIMLDGVGRGLSSCPGLGAQARDVQDAHASIVDPDQPVVLQQLQRNVGALARQADDRGQLMMAKSLQARAATIDHALQIQIQGGW